MPVMICGDGHRWDVSIEDGPSGGSACPICGQPTVRRTADGDEMALDASALDASALDATIIGRSDVGTSDEEASDGGTAPSPLPVVPGYEVLELLGRGGMGVVYRARQLALNRPVALKMIVAGRHATPQQLVRFQIEAEALACLQHDNVVRIHEVGEHDDGPYLALELVDGPSLADRLSGAPWPAAESAQLVETLARAIHAAHLRGVVHRDLKPANVLFTAEGRPKVMDFGLAKRLTEESGWTQPDAVMGTPRYMAPEQAAGDGAAVGPQTDVHALGVILYELLTGEPPFSGESGIAVLERIRTAAPVPPRRLRPRLSQDLETICLCCLEKEPKRRYESAAALADDLDRFLTGRPITARPVSVAERAVKWIRRRPAVAALLALLLVVSVASAVGMTAYNFRLRAERDRAERHFDLATAAVDQMLLEIGDDELAIEPRMEHQRRALLTNALHFARTLAREKPDDPLMQRKLGFCQRRVGDVQRLLGEFDEAEQAYRQAIVVLSQLDATSAGDPEVRRQLAGAHGFLAELLATTGRPEKAEAAYRTALRLHGGPAAETPDQQAERARVHYNFGILLKDQSATERAEEQFREAIGLLESLDRSHPNERRYSQHLARSHVNLASVLRMQGRFDDSRTAYEHARDRLRALSTRYAYLPGYRYEFALAVSNFGNLLAETGRPAEAADRHREAQEILRRLVDDYPGVPGYRQELANTCNSLGAVLVASEPDQTHQAWTEAAGQLQRLVERAPDVPGYRGDLGMVLGNLGRLHLMRGETEPARECLQNALPHLQSALRSNPEHPAYRPASQNVCRDLAAVLVRRGRCDEARGVFEDLLRGGKYRPDISLAEAFLDRTLAELSKDSASDAERPRWEAEFFEPVRGMLAARTDPHIEVLRNLLGPSHLSPSAQTGR